MPKKTTSKDPVREAIERIWPKTKKELEKAADNAKKMLVKGEEYLKEVSEKGALKTKEISLNLKKEKLYYDLGKVVAVCGISQISGSKKAKSFLKQIKDIESEVKKLKK